jgi:threonine aldolase
MLPKPMKVRIDLRSDTVTLPPPAMREAIARAELGDDVYGEDPEVNRLETLSVTLLGMEAAVFVPSGTMANLLALMAHCQRGQRVLVGDQSDVWLWEAGGAAVLGGLVYHPLPTGPSGEVAVGDLDAALMDPGDPQCAPAGLICLEDTHCMSGGRPLALDYLAAVRAFADRHRLAIHLDGARLFNAAVAQGVAAAQITRHADSVMVSLSKGLCAPIGSVVAGRHGFAAAVRRLRKMVGGGMRQAGIAAAAGVYALEHMIDRLAEDHETARLLAAGLVSIPGIEIDPQPPATNIVIFRLAAPEIPVGRFIDELAALGVGVGELGRSRVRAVTHHGIGRQEIAAALAAVRAVMARSAAEIAQ